MGHFFETLGKVLVYWHCELDHGKPIHLLRRSSQTRFILDKTLKVGCRPKSLNDLLVRARLPPETITPDDNSRRQESNKRCKKKNCRYC